MRDSIKRLRRDVARHVVFSAGDSRPGSSHGERVLIGPALLRSASPAPGLASTATTSPDVETDRAAAVPPPAARETAALRISL